MTPNKTDKKTGNNLTGNNATNSNATNSTTTTTGENNKTTGSSNSNLTETKEKEHSSISSTANGKQGNNTQSTAGNKATNSNGQGGQKQEKGLVNLLHEGIKDIYSAEKQLVEALPKMAKAAYSDELQDAFYDHYQQTQQHVARLEKVFMRLRIDREEKKCEAMEGLIEEGNKVIEEFETGPVCDSALIIAAQKIEHYEIAAYGSLVELADVLGYHKVADILERTLDEEKDTDDLLTDIATDVNDEAYEMSLEEAY